MKVFKTATVTEEKLLTLKEQYDDLLDRIAVLSAHVNELESIKENTSALNDEYKDLCAKIAIAKQEYIDTKRDLAHAEELLTTTTSVSNKLVASIDSLEIKNQTLIDNIAKMKAEEKSSAIEIENNKATLAEITSTKAKLVSQMEEDISFATKKLKELEKEISAIYTSLANSEEKLKNINEGTKISGVELSNINDSIESKNIELRNIESKIAEASSELNNIEVVVEKKTASALADIAKELDQLQEREAAVSVRESSVQVREVSINKLRQRVELVSGKQITI
jgi:chromosome segregation ATPase